MRRALFAFVALFGCTSRERAGGGNEPVRTLSEPSALLSLVRATAPFERFGRVSGKTQIDIVLPTHSNGEARIALDPARALTIRALEVKTIEGRTIEQASVFASAAPSTDLLFAREPDRFEEVRVMHDERAPATARWAITPSDGIATLRIDHGAVEALDHHGRVALRTTRLFAVDTKGVRREPALSLTHQGGTWTLEATLDRSKLAYPIVLDPVWLPGPSLAFPRSSAAAIRTADGKVYVACGGSTEFEVFDPTTSSMKSLANPGEFLSNCALFVGSDGSLRLLADGTKAFTYVPSTNTWTTGKVGTLPDGFGETGARYVTLPDGSLLQLGGLGTPPSSFVMKYVPSTDTWSSSGLLSTGRFDHAAVPLKTGKVFVAGGFNNEPLSTTEIYDPSTGTSTAGPSLAARTQKLSGLLLADGRVLLAGGNAGGSTALSDATAVYDPTAGTLVPGPKLKVARESPTLLQLKDGRVYAMGGSFSGGGTTDEVEVFDSAVKSVSAGTKMFLPRAFAPAVELLDGRILMLGGAVGATFASASTELLSSFSNGAACSWSGECASGFCASGVCCDKACTGECERCALPTTVGTCSPAPATTECGPAGTCMLDKFSARGRCSGTDTTCTSGGGGNCAGGLRCADATSCLSSCTRDADCTTLRCDTTSGLCLPPIVDAGPDETAAPAVAPVPEGSPKVLGSAQRCTSPSDCTSGFCVDGVCCDSECKDRCHSCALPSSPGRCSEEPVGVDLRAECGAALSCSGTCGKGGVCTTSIAGSQCQPSTCTGANTGKGAAVCVASGGPCGVEAAVAFECGAYVCDPAFGACRTSCTSSEACAPGFTCNVDKKNCEKLAEEDDAGCAVKDKKTGSAGAALLIGLALALRASRGSRRRGR